MVLHSRRQSVVGQPCSLLEFKGSFHSGKNAWGGKGVVSEWCDQRRGEIAGVKAPKTREDATSWFISDKGLVVVV